MPAEEFASTHWSLVLLAARPDSPQAAEALETLCRTYWYPLYAFVRRQGYNPDDAQDLTQEFFARLLEKNYLSDAHPAKGKFRSFLLGAFKHFLANERARAHAQKRGGQIAFLSWDEPAAEHRFAREPSDVLTPEKIYEHSWALTLLDKVLSQLRKEYEAGAKLTIFDTLYPHLTGDGEPASYTEVMAKLGLGESAVKMSVLRMRRRFGELLRTEIAHTVTTPGEIEEELRHLFTTLNQRTNSGSGDLPARNLPSPPQT